MHAKTLRCALLVLIVSLAGCATTSATQKVDVPVYVSCVTQVPVKPDYETKHLSKLSTDGEKIVALAKDWAYSRGYEANLEAVIQGCQ